MSKVSVVIPTYNCGKYVSEAIDSVLDQSFKDIGIIVIDDGSTDNTKEILTPYLETSKIKYFFQENKGPGAARNRGIKESDAEYVAFLDADDIWHPLKMELQMKCLLENPNIFALSTIMINYAEKDAHPLNINKYEIKSYSFEDMLLKSSMCTPTILIKKTALLEIGCFREDLSLNEDQELWLRLAKLGRLHKLMIPLVYVRIRTNSLSNSDRDKTIREYLKFIKKAFQDYYPEYKRKYLKKSLSLNYYHSSIEYTEMKKHYMAMRYLLASVRYHPIKFPINTDIKFIRLNRFICICRDFMKLNLKVGKIKEEKPTKRMTRILFLFGTNNVGGGEKVLLDYIDSLDKSCFSPFAVLPERGKLGLALDRRGITWKVIDTNVKFSKIRFLPFLFSVSKLTYYILKNKINLIHANNLRIYQLASFAALLTRTRIVCQIHYPVEEGELNYSLKIKPHSLICCCENINGEISKLLPERLKSLRIDTALNGTFLCETVERNKVASLKSKLGLSQYRSVISTIGDLSERKGQKYFIEMAYEVTKNLPDCVFLIIGEERISKNKGYRKILEEYVKDLNLEEKVIFVGAVSNVIDYILVSDVVVLHSFTEGLPLVILEAMAQAKPVVATNVNGIPEAILDGVNGFLVRPKDVSTFSNYVTTLLLDENLRLKMGLEARKRAELLFDIKKNVRGLESIYLEVLDGGRRLTTTAKVAENEFI